MAAQLRTQDPKIRPKADQLPYPSVRTSASEPELTLPEYLATSSCIAADSFRRLTHFDLVPNASVVYACIHRNWARILSRGGKALSSAAP